ncbi:MAG: DUF1499 domain-containing protein [Pseudomonadota bacterium]
MGFLSFLTAKRPSTVGVIGGRLQACDLDKSNCVCSQHKLEGRNLGPHYVQPFAFEGDPGDAMTRIIAVLMQQKNCRIAVNRHDYLHAEFSSDTLGFIDDVEFLLSIPEQVIHVRSASRLGLTDFGVNRARVKELREAFDEADE